MLMYDMYPDTLEVQPKRAGRRFLFSKLSI